MVIVEKYIAHGCFIKRVPFISLTTIKTLLFAFIFLLDINCYAQIPEISLQQCYGGSENEFASSIVTTGNGYMIFGETRSDNGDVSNNHGDRDIWIVNIDSTEVNNLVFIAENSIGTAGTQAKGILEFAYGYHYCNCINTDTSGMKSSESFDFDDLNRVFGPKVEVYPNPANEWTSFNYTLLNDETEGVINITNVTGKLIETFVVKGQKGQKIWDPRKVKKGVYLYTFTTNGISKSGKIVIIK
ncbi:MAG: hypothetical protein DRI88_04835 [Bacteroidetes bacterium]|nr:MAG: hypothetical protein DRI88_04835 [Bacteroidota bacterium]